MPSLKFNSTPFPDHSNVKATIKGIQRNGTKKVSLLNVPLKRLKDPSFFQ